MAAAAGRCCGCCYYRLCVSINVACCDDNAHCSQACAFKCDCVAISRTYTYNNNNGNPFSLSM